MAKYDGLLLYEGCLWIYSFTSVAEKKSVVPDIPAYHSQESQQPWKRNSIKKYPRFDSLPNAVIKVVCSVITYEEQSVFAALFMLYVLCQTYVWNTYAVEIYSHRFVCMVAQCT